MKNFIALAAFFIVLTGQSQEVIINDSISIEITRGKKISARFNARSTTILKNKEMQKVLARCRIKALYKQPVDINAFSLLDTVNKIRYRISEYQGYKAISFMGLGKGSSMYLKNDLRDKKGKAYPFLPSYDPSVEDSFEEFIFEGYTNAEMSINFGSNKRYSTSEAFDKRRDLISPVYYSPTNMNEFTAELFFTVLKTVRYPGLVLYYGKDLIGYIEI